MFYIKYTNNMAESTKVDSIPAEFKKIIVDMTKDILISFPEQEQNINIHLRNLISTQDDKEVEVDASLRVIYDFCKKVYPNRFFDILYQNEDILNNDNIEFLPGINFTTLWKENISDKTRETIWKYLQLVLFTIVSSISDGKSFGDSAKLFEAINEEEFKSKLEETISQMHSLFDEGKESSSSTENGEGSTSSTGSGATSGINLEDLPNPSDIHEHISGMMEGKLGSIAKEIAEETAAELNINVENAGSINDVFKKLIQNPTKLMGLVKNIGSKLDTKIKDGNIKESELLAEASELMKKMKNMPGMGNIQSMLNKMGMGGAAAAAGAGGKGGGKVNVSAMQANLERNLKNAKNKERLLQKLVDNKTAQAQQTQAQAPQTQAQQTQQAIHNMSIEEIEHLVFTAGEKAERSVRPTTGQGQAHKKKKKNKK
jgi:NADP-dependent 3-hydroxy acid dehydrogenase YdfG